MGEYHTVRRADGTVDYPCKLGTGLNWRFVRREEAIALLAFDAAEDTDIHRALREPALLWRFPFPWEDGDLEHDAVAARIEARDMGTSLAFRVEPALVGMFDHDARVLSMEATGGGYGVNVIVPCPLDPGFAAKGISSSGASPVVNICGERYDERGRGRTIFQCGYCQAPFAVPREYLPSVRDAVGRHWRELPRVEELVQRLQAVT